MKAITALLFYAALASPVFAQEAEAPLELKVNNAAEVTLDQFLWTNRAIVVFADSSLDPRFQEQIELLEADLEELLIRDIIIIVDTNPAVLSESRTKLRPRGFMLVLVGKDGQVKLRKPAPWDVREITHAIDKWPIRQKEIRDEQGKS